MADFGRIDATEKSSAPPSHIALILDGNRRFALSQGLANITGHDAGAKNLETLLPHLAKLGIAQVTLYIFSTENFARPSDEVKHLFALFERYFSDPKTIERFRAEGAQMRFIGNMSLFPPKVQVAAKNAAQDTQSCKKLIVNFVMGYGGREEITHAVRNIARRVKDGALAPDSITEKTIKENLYLQDEPQLIIRTGGEMRTSNFLPWQSIYSEWFFTDKLWPQLTTDDIDAILKQFSKRKRNFGK